MYCRAILLSAPASVSWEDLALPKCLLLCEPQLLSAPLVVEHVFLSWVTAGNIAEDSLIDVTASLTRINPRSRLSDSREIFFELPRSPHHAVNIMPDLLKVLTDVPRMNDVSSS